MEDILVQSFLRGMRTVSVFEMERVSSINTYVKGEGKRSRRDWQVGGKAGSIYLPGYVVGSRYPD